MDQITATTFNFLQTLDHGFRMSVYAQPIPGNAISLTSLFTLWRKKVLFAYQAPTDVQWLVESSNFVSIANQHKSNCTKFARP